MVIFIFSFSWVLIIELDSDTCNKSKQMKYRENAKNVKKKYKDKLLVKMAAESWKVITTVR